MRVKNEWRDTEPPHDADIMIRFDIAVAASWDAELKTWVLDRPVHVEMVAKPKAWKFREV